jgi:hypothetical protein
VSNWDRGARRGKFMAKIENHKYTIQQAFRECFYIVPDYQREYVWTDKEVQQLLNDIDEQVDGGSKLEYFIGTVLVSPGTEKDHYEVIDGQQRLTTLFLLLCALKKTFADDQQRKMLSDLISTSYVDSAGNIKTSLKLEPRYESAGEVMAKLVELDPEPQALRAGIQAAGIRSFGSLERMVNAYYTIYQSLKDNYDTPEKLKKYWGYLASNVVFIQISTEIGAALKIFETINERGLGLDSMDLLKNLLFTQVKPDEFTKLKTEWKKITAPLEKDKEKPLRFLRYFLMANYIVKNARGDAVIREDEIYDWFVDKDNAALCDYKNRPFEFVRKVTANVMHYLAFAQGLGNDGRANVTMDSLRSLTGGAFSLHYVLLLAAANLPKELFDYFVTQLESFLFYYIFTKTPTKDLERNFSVWADELREIAGIADAGTQRQQLNAFIADHFEKSMAAKSQELSDALKRLTLFSMQQYRIRYLLARLTQHVDAAYGTHTPLATYAKLEIEHVLPNTPEPELLAKWVAENKAADYQDYKNRLGNLTLLEKPINIVASNDFYELKKPEYRKSNPYLTRSLVELVRVGNNSSVTRINEKLKAFPKWNAVSIEERQDLLIGLAKSIWRTTPLAA